MKYAFIQSSTLDYVDGLQLAFTNRILGHHQVAAAAKGSKSEALRVNGGVLQNRLRSSIPERSSIIKERIRDAVDREFANKVGGT